MEITPYIKNAKQHSKKQVLALAKIVKEVGWRQPVIVNQRGVIIVGHGRYFAWKELGDRMGLKPIWVMNDSGQTIHGESETTPMTEEQEKTYRLADNKLNESKWEMEIVIEELKIMTEEIINLTGFDSNLVLETREDKPDLSKVGVPRSVVGDLYELGRHIFSITRLKT